jgi:hypothetical protein
VLCLSAGIVAFAGSSFLIGIGQRLRVHSQAAQKTSRIRRGVQSPLSVASERCSLALRTSDCRHQR